MEKQKKTTRLIFRFTPDEKAAVKKLSKIEGLSLSEITRRTLRMACQQRGIELESSQTLQR